MKVNQNVLRFFLGYLGGELNQACVRNGTGAESESFYFIFVRITKMRAKHSTKSLCFEIILHVVYKFDEIKVGVEEGEGGGTHTLANGTSEHG